MAILTGAVRGTGKAWILGGLFWVVAATVTASAGLERTPPSKTEGLRRFWDAVKRGGEGGSVPSGVKVLADLPYAGHGAGAGHERQRLDLLLPQAAARQMKAGAAAPAALGSRRLPVVVYIHGGAFRGGDRRMGWPVLGDLVASGDYAGVTIGYRLSGDAVWPAQLHDCKAAVRWIRAHADQYRLDPDRIAVWGMSAGGHLASLLGLTQNDPELEGIVGPHLDRSSRVTCVVDFYGPADFRTIGDFPSRIDHNAADSPGSLLIGATLANRPDLARAASPITYIHPGSPPFLIVHGKDDPSVPWEQSAQFHNALRAAGVSSRFVTIPNGGHGNFRNPEIGRRVRLFLENQLQNARHPISDTPIPNDPQSQSPILIPMRD